MTSNSFILQTPDSSVQIVLAVILKFEDETDFFLFKERPVLLTGDDAAHLLKPFLLQSLFDLQDI